MAVAAMGSANLPADEPVSVLSDLIPSSRSDRGAETAPSGAADKALGAPSFPEEATQAAVGTGARAPGQLWALVGVAA